MHFGILEFLMLAGSLALFIHGMKLLSEGLQKTAGGGLRRILGAMTANPFRGLLTGFTTTALVQYSSVTTVMVVSFVNAGLLSLRQSIPVIMGANIGTTLKALLPLAWRA
jgi:phosphate:Na+ symporter